MSSKFAIRVEGLSKCYHIYDHPRDRLKQMIVPRIQRALGWETSTFYREFWALESVSFEVKKGETVGIIGRNGSGKSTLLQLVSGTLNQTAGSIEVNGRVAALLELGSGFNPEFTGRENVYLNAAVLGLSRDEIDLRFDAIVEFADIGEFIDQPVKSYSSGMMVRLAFAVQAQVSPDILIVDEALAVGDVKFQAKCFERLRQLKEEGTSILLVTHSSEQIVTHCSRAILLDNGCQVEYGEPKHVVNRYLDILFGKEKLETYSTSTDCISYTDLELDANKCHLSTENDVFSTRNGYNPHEYRWGDGSAKILDFSLTANGEMSPVSFVVGQSIKLRLSIKFLNALIRPILGITIKSKEGVTIYGVNSETLNLTSFQKFGAAGTVVEAEAIFDLNLAAGDYFISVGIASKSGEEIIPHDRRYDSIHLQVSTNNTFFGLVNMGIKLSARQL